jgi:hypothetical protein
VSRLVAALAGVLLLAGCASVRPETPEERQARYQAACNEAGLSKDSESYRLCLLIQQQNDRLAAVERRLGFIEGQVSAPIYPYRWWP